MSGLMRDADTGLAWRRAQPAPAAPRSMLVLLHGVGGNETQLAGLAATAGPDVLVVLPQGRLAFGPGQFGWFRAAFTTNGPQIEPEEAEASRIALIRWVANLQREYAIPPSRTVIAGFSQGGIMSASVGLTAPDRVAGFGVLSGRILPELEASLAPSASLRSVRGFIGHGLHDPGGVGRARGRVAYATGRGTHHAPVPHRAHDQPGHAVRLRGLVSTAAERRFGMSALVRRGDCTECDPLPTARTGCALAGKLVIRIADKPRLQAFDRLRGTQGAAP